MIGSVGSTPLDSIPSLNLLFQRQKTGHFHWPNHRPKPLLI
jgi:hypothetical protein